MFWLAKQYGRSWWNQDGCILTEKDAQDNKKNKIFMFIKSDKRKSLVNFLRAFCGFHHLPKSWWKFWWIFWWFPGEIPKSIVAFSPSPRWGDWLHSPKYSVTGIPQRLVYRLYKDLYDGKTIEFDLCIGEKSCFDVKSNFSIITKTKFLRKLHF